MNGWQFVRSLFEREIKGGRDEKAAQVARNRRKIAYSSQHLDALEERGREEFTMVEPGIE